MRMFPVGGVELRYEDFGNGLPILFVHGFPLDHTQCEALTPMVGLGGLSVLVNWDGRIARLIAAETPLGPWHAG